MAVGIFDSINTTNSHNRVLEANFYSCVACRERFVMPQPTGASYKPMIKVQMPLYKTDGVVPTHTGRKIKFPVLRIKEMYRTCKPHISSRFTGSNT